MQSNTELALNWHSWQFAMAVLQREQIEFPKKSVSTKYMPLPEQEVQVTSSEQVRQFVKINEQDSHWKVEERMANVSLTQAVQWVSLVQLLQLPMRLAQVSQVALAVRM